MARDPTFLTHATSSVSPAAIVAYEAGTRDPTVETLVRIVAAAGAEAGIRVEAERPLLDSVRSAQRLAQVLDLAERLPRRRAARRLAFPPFPRSG